ncbi:hypothetical protein WJX73_003669 [Symbiochloris irregularis]|uniref:F-box domain-containing protein n=1 Tax=Symbiochloris irregularis TaxID=706552 RepID=A0AAW1NLQ2_9CHLO
MPPSTVLHGSPQDTHGVQRVIPAICMCSSEAGAAAALQRFKSPEVQDVMSANVLPLLDLCDLGALACTCTTLRDMAYKREDHWQSAAEAHLPADHPSVAELGRKDLQQVMQRRFQARSNIASGQAGVRLDLAWSRGSIQQVAFSSCGDYIAVITPFHVAVSSSEGFTMRTQTQKIQM